MGKDQVTNISTALMAINELSSCYDIPINIHFDAKGRIYVHVGFGTLYRKEMSFYPQDTYRAHSKTDDIYKWIEEAIETLAVKKGNSVLHATRDKNGNLLRGLRAEVPNIFDDATDIPKEVIEKLIKAPRGYNIPIQYFCNLCDYNDTSDSTNEETCKRCDFYKHSKWAKKE